MMDPTSISRVQQETTLQSLSSGRVMLIRTGFKYGRFSWEFVLKVAPRSPWSLQISKDELLYKPVETLPTKAEPLNPKHI